ncbi:hypothetical protein [Formosa sp. A9]|uniref:hypothetical protein n=1 Tax=Formosa sp. A9 TaxID=3442641 RepID=UPI003EC07DFE
MRTDNGKVKQIIISVYFILIVLAIVLATVFSAFKDLTTNATLTFLVIFLVFVALFFAVYLIARYFEYDSDGVKVVVTNKGLLLPDKFSFRTHEIEFEKSDLKAFKFNNYVIYKSLALYLKTASGHTIKEQFNITLVNRKKRKYVRQSLSKMVKNNSENKG